MAGCQGKRAYPDLASANFARKLYPRSARLAPYRCKSCGKLHIGSSLRADIEGGAFNRARFLHEIRAKEAMSDAWRHA